MSLTRHSLPVLVRCDCRGIEDFILSQRKTKHHICVLSKLVSDSFAGSDSVAVRARNRELIGTGSHEMVHSSADMVWHPYQLDAVVGLRRSSWGRSPWARLPVRSHGHAAPWLLRPAGSRTGARRMRNMEACNLSQTKICLKLFWPQQSPEIHYIGGYICIITFD